MISLQGTPFCFESLKHRRPIRHLFFCWAPPLLMPSLGRHSYSAQWEIDSGHDVLLLLRNIYVTISQLLYLLRTSPSFLSPTLKVYDDVLRSVVGMIANTRLDDNAWNQASLPVKAGGLGIRSTVQLAPLAFLSSAAASADLVRHILPSCFGPQDLLHVDSTLASWSLDHVHPPPVVRLPIARRFGMLPKYLRWPILCWRMLLMHLTLWLT